MLRKPHTSIIPCILGEKRLLCGLGENGGIADFGFLPGLGIERTQCFPQMRRDLLGGLLADPAAGLCAYVIKLLPAIRSDAGKCVRIGVIYGKRVRVSKAEFFG